MYLLDGGWSSQRDYFLNIVRFPWRVDFCVSGIYKQERYICGTSSLAFTISLLFACLIFYLSLSLSLSFKSFIDVMEFGLGSWLLKLVASFLVDLFTSSLNFPHLKSSTHAYIQKFIFLRSLNLFPKDYILTHLYAMAGNINCTYI